MGITKEISHAMAGLIEQGVVGRELHGRINTMLSLTIDTVECQRVVNSLIMEIDSQFQRVHHRGVTLQGCCSLTGATRYRRVRKKGIK